MLVSSIMWLLSWTAVLRVTVSQITERYPAMLTSGTFTLRQEKDKSLYSFGHIRGLKSHKNADQFWAALALLQGVTRRTVLGMKKRLVFLWLFIPLISPEEQSLSPGTVTWASVCHFCRISISLQEHHWFITESIWLHLPLFPTKIYPERVELNFPNRPLPGLVTFRNREQSNSVQSSGEETVTLGLATYIWFEWFWAATLVMLMTVNGLVLWRWWLDPPFGEAGGSPACGTDDVQEQGVSQQDLWGEEAVLHADFHLWLQEVSDLPERQIVVLTFLPLDICCRLSFIQNVSALQLLLWPAGTRAHRTPDCGLLGQMWTGTWTLTTSNDWQSVTSLLQTHTISTQSSIKQNETVKEGFSDTCHWFCLCSFWMWRDISDQSETFHWLRRELETGESIMTWQKTFFCSQFRGCFNTTSSGNTTNPPSVPQLISK